MWQGEFLNILGQLTVTESAKITAKIKDRTVRTYKKRERSNGKQEKRTNRGIR